MCGIAGFLNLDGSPASSREVRAMTDAIAHRGPDGDGVYCHGAVGLGHRRLAIIDLEAGKQPLSNEDETVWITFNGEIYNYRELRRQLLAKGHVFHTASDTEVIVHAYEEWGADCVKRLRGMFAFAIWDDRQQRLFLARDRFGIKPLYYYCDGRRFAFASELQAFEQLAGFAPSIDVRAIDLYLHYQYIPAPYSIYQEVRKLPPAQCMMVDRHRGVGEPQSYWDFAFVPDRITSEEAWVERLDAALEETVRAHLTSDVPFGAFLSGGIDSSTVVAYMSRILKEPVRAFTIGHADERYDETGWAQQAASLCGAAHFVETVEPNALELLPKLVRHYGEPFGDSSAVATYAVSQLARQHVKMVLSGDGGDEIFAGYHAYAAILWEHDPPLSATQRMKLFVADRARQAGLWPPRPSVSDAKFARTAVLDPDLRRQLWQPEYANLVDQTAVQFRHQFRQRPGEDLLGRLQHFDVSNYIAYDNCPKVDVASMCHGLEVRVPLLDHVFLETVSRIPLELKLRSANEPKQPRTRLRPGEPLIGKYLLKQAAARFFPHDFLHRQKRGFEVPIQNWFGGSYFDALQDRLTTSSSRLHRYFQSTVLQDLVTQSAQSRTAAWKVWSLLVLDEWLGQRTQPRNAQPAALAETC